MNLSSVTNLLGMNSSLWSSLLWESLIIAVYM